MKKKKSKAVLVKWDLEEQGIKVLKGKTLIKIYISKNGNKDYIEFMTAEGQIFLMIHNQECCEQVTLEDVCGDIKNLLNSPVLVAEERSNKESTIEGSETWTFYEIATIKGYVSLRWYGESNGCYSESANFFRKV